MVRTTPHWAAALLSVAGTAAMAGPGPEDGRTGPYISGDVELEFNLSDDVTDDLPGLRGDVRAGLLMPATGAVQFGAEVGVIAYDLPGPAHLSAIEAVGFVTGGFGTFSLGAPLAADADFGPQTVFDRTVINTFLLVEARPTVGNFMLAYQDPVPGARYDGSFGDIDIALSVHEFTQGANATAVSTAASYEGGFFTLTGEATHIDTAGNGVSTFGLSAESGFGPVGGAVEILSIEGDDHIYTLEGRYAVSERFSVAAGLRELDTSRGGPNTSWLVEAEYGFGNGAYLNATAGRTLGNGEAAVGLGLEF